MTSLLTLCADDFGHSAAISLAILELADARRINATSLMVDGAEAAAAAAAIAPIPHVSLGLHLTLSGERAPFRSALAPGGRLPHVDALTARAFAGRLPIDAIAAEIERQYDRFEDLAGRPPAFVDGHQHVHMLPGIRGAFLRIAQRRAPGAWVRTCEESLATIWRRGAFRWTAARSALLSRGLSAQTDALGLRANRGFAGLYDFRASRDYGRLFASWLTRPGSAHLVICHPAMPDATDPLGAARANEFRFLRGADLDTLLAASGLHIAA